MPRTQLSLQVGGMKVKERHTPNEKQKRREPHALVLRQKKNMHIIFKEKKKHERK